MSPWIFIQINNFSKLPAPGIEPLTLGLQSQSFTSTPWATHYINIISVSGHDVYSLHYQNTSNICRHKYDQLWIHELFNQTFGRFLDFGPTVCHHWPPFVYGLESARHLLEERPNESRVWAAEEKHYWHFLHNLLNKSMGLNLMNLKKAVAEN